MKQKVKLGFIILSRRAWVRSGSIFSTIQAKNDASIINNLLTAKQ